MSLRILSCLCAALLLVGVAVASVPQLINYQGVLTSGGSPVTAPVNVIFAIWDAEIDGDSLWSEQQQVTPDNEGRFNVLLGSIAEIPDSVFRDAAYLSIKAGSDAEMAPRQQIVSVGYSFRVGTIDGASGGTISDSLIITDPDGDTLFLDPEKIVIRGAGGDEEVVYSSTGMEIYTDEPSMTALAGAPQVLRRKVMLTEDSLIFYDASETPKISITSSGGVPSIVVGDPAESYELPVADGSVGQVMVTDGTGTVDWANPAGGWTHLGSRVYLTTDTDSVGIGTSAPAEKLDVSGNIHASGTITSGNSIIIDGVNDKITATSGTIDFDNEHLVTEGKASFGWNNNYSGDGVFVAGGSNSATGDSSAIGGGNSNVAGNFCSTVGGGLANLALGQYATIGGGYYDTAFANYTTIAGGRGNFANGPYSSIGGGQENTAGDDNFDSYATVGGGFNNLADTSYATVSGGLENRATGAGGGTGATVGGGAYNTASTARATVSGGERNDASGWSASVGGGGYNMARGDYSVVAGGGGGSPVDSNLALGSYSAVGGGRRNRANGMQATVGGGYRNIVSAGWGVISGGRFNTADSNATVGGGSSSTASGYSATIGGGSNNGATGITSTVGGGFANLAGGEGAAVGGGGFNRARGKYAVVAGGGGVLSADSNLALRDFSAVGGGKRNVAKANFTTISGGLSNVASGTYATVPGGELNEAAGMWSLAAGRRAKAGDNGTFVWADDNNFDFPTVTESNFTPTASMFLVRSTQGAVFVTGIDLVGNSLSGVQLGGGGGSWQSLSDRNLKENIQPVDGAEVLAKIASLPISTWNYKTQDESIRHIGPMAQDLYAAFGLGEDDRHITTIDGNGVALAAIQGLYQQNLEQQQENVELKERVEQLEVLVKELLAKRQ